MIWYSFQLDPNAPAVGEGSNVQRVADKYGVPLEQMEEQHRSMGRAGRSRPRLPVGTRSSPAIRMPRTGLHHYARSGRVRGRVHGPPDDGVVVEGAIGDDDARAPGDREAGLRRREVRGPDPMTSATRSGHRSARQPEIGITSVPMFVPDQK